jgi:hypothetical protein
LTDLFETAPQRERRLARLARLAPTDSTESHLAHPPATHAHTAIHDYVPPTRRLRRNRSPSPPRRNPIDTQKRPRALSSSEMTVSIACRICNEQKVDALALPCSHLCMCHWCSDIIQDNARDARRRRRDVTSTFMSHEEGSDVFRCPICRAKIDSVKRIFLC